MYNNIPQIGVRLVQTFALLILTCTISVASTTSNDTVTLRVPAKDIPKLSRVQVISRTDYGAFSVVEVPRTAIEILKSARARIQEEKTAGLIGLQGRPMDTKGTIPTVNKSLSASLKPSTPTLFLLQFVGPTKSEWISEIEAVGGKIISYIPENSYLVWIQPLCINRLHLRGFLKWNGPYHPAYKISKDLDNAVGMINYISVVIYDDPTKSTIKSITDLGAYFVRELDSPFNPDVSAVTVLFSADAKLIDKIARLPRVIRIDKSSPVASLDDEAASQIISGHHINGIPYSPPTYKNWLQQIGVDGTGSTVAVVDTGCDTNVNSTMHQDLKGQMSDFIGYLLGDSTDKNGHGTHVAGIIAGTAAKGTLDDEGFLFGLGVAPGSKLVVQNAMSSTYFPPPLGWAGLTHDSVSKSAFVSNNSWGLGDINSIAIGYTSVCATFDLLVRDASPSSLTGTTPIPGLQPLTLVFALGNDGSTMTSIHEPKEAKNIITVGASENYRPTAPLSGTCGKSTEVNGIANFSSRGPCVDGRFAPTIVAPGTNIASTASYTGQYTVSGQCKSLIQQATPHYAWMSGTSMAAPMVSGALALVGQWWRNTHAAVNPSPAMCKAIIVNGADDIAGGPDGRGGKIDHIPNGDQGWGRLNLASIINPANTYYDDQTCVFTTTGQDHQYCIRVADQSKPLKVTLVWTDAAGTPGANAWVNDLDLEVAGQAGTYIGNVFQDGWSTVGGSRDSKNNTECVYIEHPSGTYNIDVIAANIAGDAIPGNTSALEQDYAIVIRNGILTDPALYDYTPVEISTTPKPDPYLAELGNGGWSAIGLRPSAGIDDDISLYTDPSHTILGASSNIRGNGVDIIAIDGNQLSAGTVYPVVSPYFGNGGYQVEWATSTGTIAQGTPTPVTFAENEILRTWDIDVATAASCTVRVVPTSGDLDLGIAVFGSTPGQQETFYRPRNQAIAEVDAAGIGQAETLIFQLPSAGRYGLVVWSKSGSGTFTVQYDPVQASPPTVTPDVDYTTDLTQLGASWAPADPHSVIAKYEYAIGTTPGATNVFGWADVGTATRVTKTGLTLIPGQNYHFTVRSTDTLGAVTIGVSKPVLAVLGLTDIAVAKQQADETTIALTPKMVTARFSDRFYISENNRYTGIGVIWPGDVTEGSLVTVIGKLKLIAGERVIEAIDVK